MDPLEDPAAAIAQMKAAPLAYVADEVARTLKMAVDHNKTCKDCARPEKPTRDFLDHVAQAVGHYTAQNVFGAQMAFRAAVTDLEGLSDRAADDLKRADAARKVRETAYLLAAMMGQQANMLQALIRTQMKKSGGEAARGMALLEGFAKEMAEEHARVGAMHPSAGGVTLTKSNNVKPFRVN